MVTVIVIDDNYMIRKGLSKKINQLPGDFSVICDAGDSIEGLRLILEKKPQIVVTDIRMPGNTGLEMIRNVYEAYHPQTIIISGYTEFEYAKEALKLGVLAYLVKPIEENELLEALKKAAANLGQTEPNQADADDAAVGTAPSEELQLPDSSGALQNDYVTRTIEYINTHYADNLKVSDIAERLALSESYLSRIFKNKTGFTITDYRICCCIAVAELELEEPGVKIYEISEKVGFVDQRHFSKLFRQKTGYTPMEYRERVLTGIAPRMKTREDHLIANICKSMRK